MVDFKNFLSGKGETPSKEYYWALVLESDWVQVGIWKVKEEKAEVISVSPATPWGEDEELVSAADAALTSAIQNLTEDVSEPSKTVFGVSSTWVSKGQIKPEYLEKLKGLCSKLSLEPAGFVILPEAIAHFFKSEEGSPLSAVVLGVGNENLEVSVFRLGTLVGTSQVARSVSIVDDVSEGLARFTGGDPLPSRFLLYDGKEGELEETKQALLKAQWDDYEKLKFLHTPKVEIISPDKKVIATCLAGASEIADVFEVYTGREKKETKEKEVPSQETENLVTPEKAVSPEDVGFVVGQDVAASKIPEDRKKPEIEPSKKPTPRFEKKFNFAILNKMKEKLSGLKFPTGKKPLILGGAIFLLLIMVGFILWWFLPKAVVTIYVAPKKLDERISIFIDTKAQSPDFEEKILPGKLIDTNVSGEKTKSTTGTKTVGEKAKGTVEIRNGTAEGIRIPAGTTILTATNFEFSLDSAASVSAAQSTTSPGTVNVDVTATDIGAEYNLAKDESFKVGNYLKADLEAVVTADFSGGSSRDIAAVSADDQESLEEDLTEELLDKAEQELKISISDDEFFIDESLVATVSTRDFSNKVGDEASNLKLDLTLEASGLVIEKVRLDDLVKEVLKDKVPSGFILREDQIAVTFDLQDSEGGVFEFLATIDVNLLPEVKPDEIAKKIVGRYPPLAQDFLTTIPGFTRAEINLKPKLPGRLGTLPHVIKNLTIELAAER
ncbi:hypothetical protein E3I18_00475 [Candidatus Woesebacteria bacterium]|nr:MAG: hypothetical protein E3I18_00475 [Candidatus Woesebacteria bacterium]